MYTPISEFDKTSLNTTESYIHRAAQFLAMVGKNYLDDQPDDSNANLNFDANTSSIQSRDFGNGYSLELNVPDWKLNLKRTDETGSLEIVGQTKETIFDWLQTGLEAFGLDGSKLKFIDHYDVPPHAVDQGQSFPSLDYVDISHWLTMRSNANVLLARLNELIGVNSEIRIWPHHFDTGSYYELGEKKAIGAGWAIEDTLCDNPYLYIYGWNGNEEIKYEGKPDLPAGKWIITETWQGAVFEAESLSTLPNQIEMLETFMSEVATFYKSQLA